MQGPLNDLVQLVLLIGLFGFQQRNRQQRYYRFWFVGWLCIFLAYAVWEVPLPRGWERGAQQVLQVDLSLLGSLAFLLAFVEKTKRLWLVVTLGALVGVPMVVVIDLYQFGAASKMLLTVGIVAWHVYGVYASHRLLGRMMWRKWVIDAVCVAFAAGMLVGVWTRGGPGMEDWALAEVLLCAGILFPASGRRWSSAEWIGTLGFAAWAVFHLLGAFLERNPVSLKLLHQFWNFPKYFVGFAMTLKVFEDGNDESARLAENFRAMYEDFRLMYDEHPFPTWIYAVDTERLLSANRAAVADYGYSEEEFQAMRVGQMELPEDEELEATAQLMPLGAGERRTRYRCRDGRVRWVNVVDRSILYKGQEARLLMARDVTERLKSHAEMARRVQHDELTGLPNRTLLAERMKKSLARAERDGRKCVLFTIDIDHFKKINDTYGHLVGDECLQTAARRMQSKIRKVDMIARTGGEEFTAIIGDLNAASDARKIAELLLHSFDEPILCSCGPIAVTISVGGAVYPDDSSNEETLRRLSDEALYAAKRGGRNRAAFAAELGLTRVPAELGDRVGLEMNAGD
jgi:diguanylate cyclase (GGDEF)-like protein/PAS domain S-box-containing protein